MRRFMRPLLAALVFVVVVLWGLRVNPPLREGFNSFQDQINRMVQQLQQATGNLGKEKSYNDWVGYAYKNANTADKALNDFKSRVFQPTCLFRRDWAENVPGDKGRPLAPENKTVANAAYKSFLDCLAQGNQQCLEQLNDARDRFMQPNCEFQRHENGSAYNRNYTPVFD